MGRMKSEASNRRGGRPRKLAEKREYFGFYVPPDLAEYIRTHADELDTSYSDLIGRTLADAFGFPWKTVYTKQGTKDQGELPLDKTA